jgi:hypothetical protein
MSGRSYRLEVSCSDLRPDHLTEVRRIIYPITRDPTGVADSSRQEGTDKVN